MYFASNLRKGTIKSKSLIESLENNPNKPISSFYSLMPPLIVSKDTSLFEMLMIFQDKGQTISLINDEVKKTKSVAQKTHEEQFFSVFIIEMQKLKKIKKIEKGFDC